MGRVVVQNPGLLLCHLDLAVKRLLEGPILSSLSLQVIALLEL